ncbi:unnamed protein product [Phyllotreta striolata]|uniref:RING-type domain-containing protein n=1 Tax=Phyllotreta striolata TaxID=444603 RepID=A0A9N9XM88_PHYSR|nr:unnamed protein product [Phyllotreta striolata]
MSTSFLFQDEEFLGWWPFLREFILALGSEIMEEIHCVEQFFIKIKSLYAFVSQVCFFVLVDLLLEENENFDNEKGDKSVVMALTSVLFYSVFGYFVSRIKDVFHRQRFQLFRSFLTIEHLVTWIFKVILEWVKAIVIVLCLREQGLNYQPSLLYSILTFLYYLCSEKIFVETLPDLFEMLSIEKFENLEHLYVPMAMNFFTVLAGTVVSTYFLLVQYSNFVLLSVYFLVYIRLKDIYYNYWKLLIVEREIFRSFRIATKEEIDSWNDICAVCLTAMSRARITPCNHLFHSHCLKRCLKSSLLCPLCKTHFLDGNSEIKL